MNFAPLIRPYRADDRAALYDICVRTGDQGGDSRELYPDHDLLPSIFAGPYAELDPDLVFVLDDGERAVGYVLGTADTADFIHRYQREWLPDLAARYPALTEPPVTPSEFMIDLLHHPERMFVPDLAAYPAHLHIDLLPSHQRAGHGRTLIHTFLRALNHRGVEAVHLGMVTANTAARAFYDRLGFHEIPVRDSGSITHLGRSTEFVSVD
jgi:ribosomal protein S18 acetylase RimI-like enzyme